LKIDGSRDRYKVPGPCSHLLQVAVTAQTQILQETINTLKMLVPREKREDLQLGYDLEVVVSLGLDLTAE